MLLRPQKALFQGLVLLAPMLSLERAKRAPGNRILLWVLAMLADSSARGVALRAICRAVNTGKPEARMQSRRRHGTHNRISRK
jgi:hypothetical protein